MKRDMDLVRAILMQTEAAAGPYDAGVLTTSEWSFEMVAYHAELMAAHGLIDIKPVRAAGGITVRLTIISLTWDGCDYLDAVRNDLVWERTKGRVRETVGSTTLALIKEVALYMARQALGIA